MCYYVFVVLSCCCIVVDVLLCVSICVLLALCFCGVPELFVVLLVVVFVLSVLC